MTIICCLGSQIPMIDSDFATSRCYLLLLISDTVNINVGGDGCMLGLLLTPNDGRLHCSGQLRLPLDPAPPPSLR
jgi:hypothetical protein